MNRGTHRFQFTAKQLGEAARAEYEYHRGRVDWWKSEQEAAIAEAKKAGISVQEYAVTGGQRIQVVIDPTMQSRLNECGDKINWHRAMADRFKIEASAYATQPPERSYDLDPDDVVYFRLVGGPREE